jgi:hypothetical protein
MLRSDVYFTQDIGNTGSLLAFCQTADPDYQAFLKQLEEGPSSQPSATAQLEAAEAEARQAAAAAAAGSGGAEGASSSGDTGVVTPLIAFLREKFGSSGALPKRGGRGGRRKEAPLLEVEEVGACTLPTTGLMVMHCLAGTVICWYCQ